MCPPFPSRLMRSPSTGIVLSADASLQQTIKPLSIPVTLAINSSMKPKVPVSYPDRGALLAPQGCGISLGLGRERIRVLLRGSKQNPAQHLAAH